MKFDNIKKNKFTYHKKRSVKWYLLDRAFDLGMGTHTKIIVTTPNLNWALAPSVFQGIRELLPTSVDFFKHPVGMIHFLLQNLTLEKILILKSNLCQNNQIKQNYQMEFKKKLKTLLWNRRQLSAVLLLPHYADAHTQHNKKFNWHQNGTMN